MFFLIQTTQRHKASLSLFSFSLSSPDSCSLPFSSYILVNRDEKKKNLQILTSGGPFLQIGTLNETVALELSYTDIRIFSNMDMLLIKVENLFKTGLQ